MSMASSLDTIGALSKNVEDTALILQTIAGKDPQDATTSDQPVPDFRKALTPLRPVRTGTGGQGFGRQAEYEERKMKFYPFRFPLPL